VPRCVRQRLSGWGNLPVHEASVYRAHRWHDAIDVVAQACSGRGVIARGLGRSYGDAALNDAGAVLLLTRLDRLLAFDADAGVVECEGGVSLGDLLEVFVPRGWFLPVTPGTKHVTVGGAIAADVHGKNHHRDGSFAAFVLDLRLLTGAAEVVTCSREANQELFWATLGGMGLTGVVLSARLRLRAVRTGYMRVDTVRCASLDEVLQQFEESDRSWPYSVAWIDCMARGRSLGRTILMRADHAAPDELDASRRSAALQVRGAKQRNVPLFAPGALLNPFSVRLFNAGYYALHPARHGQLCHYEPFFYPLDALGHWNRIYGRSGFIQYQVAFPSHSSRVGLIALLEAISKSGRASFLAVLKSFGAPSGGLLSFPLFGHTLALDIPNRGSNFAQFVAGLNRITLAHGGRVYLAKDAFLDPDSFSSMYPAAARFRAVKQQSDPRARFSSSLSRRLGLTHRPCKAAS
jgi:decaprenylphospho-beta-D-ribofuranose 2-oxidase